MARKRSTKKMEDVMETKLQPVRVDLERKTHDLLRLVAASERMSMARYAKTMLAKVVHEQAREKGLG